MESKLCLAGLHLRFTSERPIRVGHQFDSFGDDPEAVPDVTVPFLWDWSQSRTAQTPMLGKNLQQHYYAEDGLRFCQTWGSPKGYIASTVYTPDFRTVKCYVNQEPFINPLNDLTTLIRYLPLREMFQRFGVLFLHSSQVETAVKGDSVLRPLRHGKDHPGPFMAEIPGCGADLQRPDAGEKNGGRLAHLWLPGGRLRPGAQRKGAAPGCGGAAGAGPGQRGGPPVRGKGGGPSDGADGHRRVEPGGPHPWGGATLAMALLGDVPVCLLRCTPDEGAVECLERWLREQGVI
ncbi:MAG: hypothetical protein LUD80_00900 [Clostridiales bacterium]|nr:hypothetical protein [Clostridiales bacterium]